MSRRFTSMVPAVLACGLLVASSLGAREAVPSVGAQGIGINIDPNGLTQGIGFHIDAGGLTQGIGFHIDAGGLTQGIGFNIDPGGLTQGLGFEIDPTGLVQGQVSSESLDIEPNGKARQSICGQ